MSVEELGGGAAGAVLAVRHWDNEPEAKIGFWAKVVDDEITGRDTDFWQTYRDKIAAVTADDVLEIAKSQLMAENMAFFIVGDWDPINKGDLEGKANMSEFGEVQHLPLRDPLTQEPI